jgi:hypothetical protein
MPHLDKSPTTTPIVARAIASREQDVRVLCGAAKQVARDHMHGTPHHHGDIRSLLGQIERNLCA